MSPRDLDAWRHSHAFDAGNAAGERGTRQVVWLTAATMVGEVLAGWLFNSMALLADGLHMGSHAVAIGVSAAAYVAARRLAGDHRFAFGTWKIEVLGGFASAVFLLGVALLMAAGSVERLFAPQPISYGPALLVAVIGLAVNLVSALILGLAHSHGHVHGHSHSHGHSHDPDHGGGRPPHDHAHDHAHEADGPHDAAAQAAPSHRHRAPPTRPPQDLNLRSAYVHVITDALTSVLAIVALAGGWWLGWAWLDPVMGLVGAVVVALWARRLIADTARVLLDREMDQPVVEDIRQAIEQGGRASGTRVADLHVWRVGRAAYACALTLVTHDRALRPDTVRRWLAVHEEVAHVTVEINHWGEAAGTGQAAVGVGGESGAVGVAGTDPPGPGAGAGGKAAAPGDRAGSPPGNR